MPSESIFPRIDIPSVDIWSFLFERKDRAFPNEKVIYRDADFLRSYTYAQVKSTATDFGKGLKSQWHWQKDDVLALVAANCVDTPAIIWGCHWAGGIVSPANPAYTSDELAFQLRDAGAKAVMTQKEFLPTVRRAAREVEIPESRIILLGDPNDSVEGFKHFTSICATDVVEKLRRTRVRPDVDLAFLVYSSGTTGKPKGVMLSHTNIIANVLQNVVDRRHLSWNGGPDGKGDSIMACLPFFHIYGLTCLIHQALHSGWTATIMARFDLERFCQIVQDHGITFGYVVPPVVLLLAKHPVVDKYDLSSIRILNSGAAPLTRDLVEAVFKRLSIRVKQGYGLSETSPVTHSQRWEDWQSAVGSVGVLLPNQTAKYMDSEERELPAGKVGELWIKGPNVFKGYLNNPEGTQNALTSEGYFRTGDVGYVDSQGNFYITDRVKELIKYKGFQVAPAELEGILLSHPAINDVAVLGFYDDAQATELPRAYVVLEKRENPSQEMADGIAEWLSAKVAGYKRLRGGVHFVDEIPKSASGKILRRILRDRAQEAGKTKAKL